MEKRHERKLAAIMFTDMVGYTALVQDDEAKARTLRDRCREILQRYVGRRGGTILQFYGDGTLCSFQSAIEATRCALEIQQALRLEPRVPVRIGIHVGDVVFEEEGIFGDGVNVASRIEHLAASGGICVSERVYDDIRNQPDLEATSLGRRELKNVKRPIEIFALTGEGLGVPEVGELTEGGDTQVRTATGLETPTEDMRRASRPTRTVAVLPFVNMSADPENEYFSDGITEEVINALTKVEGLSVTSRTSSFAFKGKHEDIRKIGAQLNVHDVLEGSVRKAGAKVRITAQLISVADGFHHWSEVYNRELEDIFDIQDDISRSIANKLGQAPADAELKEALVKPHTKNLEAYNLYLKGSFNRNKWTPDAARKAIRYYEEAIQAEPSFALPYCGLAGCFSFLGMMGQLLPTKAFPKAKEAALRALDLDNTLAEAHMSLALVQLYHDFDLGGAYNSFQEALRLNPGGGEVHATFALHRAAVGKFDEAIRELELAVQLDPLSLPIITQLGDAYCSAERYEAAIEQYDRALEMDPSFRAALVAKGVALMEKGETDIAIDVLKQYQKQTGDPLKGVGPLGWAYAKVGQLEKAEMCLQKLKEREQLDKDISLKFDQAAIYCAMKDYKNAFHYLEQAFDNRVGIFFTRTHPALKDIRSHPDYGKLMERVGLKIDTEKS
jgi:TolB-like protein/class 3 adenylate cyclase/Tfp pilus assembly protein PilF